MTTRAAPLLVLLLLSGCADTYCARPSAPADDRVASAALYLVGDFGTPGPGFMAVTAAIAADVARDEAAGRIAEAPWILELGDNMYVEGLPRPSENAGRERARLQKMGAALAACRYGGQPVPLYLIPGNHDYADEPLAPERTYGDITRWFFLVEELGLEDLASWTPVPGRLAPEDRSSAGLYARIYASPADLAAFMAPVRIPDTPPGLGVVAIDSELLIGLLDAGHEDLAERYLAQLRAALRELPPDGFRAVAGHHPLESYGNRPAQLGRFLLGPGWPQFPEWWHKLLVVPPFGTLATLGRWAAHSRHDIHSGPYEAYRARVHRVLVEEGVDLFFAGHDHDHQLIDLGEAFGEGHVLQVLTGSGAKANHPVTDGPGTLCYHLGHGYVRVLVFPGKLQLELKDLQGRTLFRYALEQSG